MKLNKKIFFTFSSFFFYFFLASKKVFADWTNANEPAGFKDLETVFTNILKAIIPLVGVVIFVFLVYGGFTILTAAGNPEKTKKGSGIITWAIIGLLVILSAWLILSFIQTITGVNVTTFQVITQ
ncbi:DUF485 domain-containing protein [Candidatus Beckwithbacteria bacterium]|nr:DUF485 domain-containing protein [Candidatus Beckwithbacteria bacterium]